MKELYEYVINFMAENDINCEEDIYQRDSLSTKFHDFMASCFDCVKDELV
jgi:hypothetical protein